MKYKVYKFAFQGAVHFGKQNLEDGEPTCCADMIFSALCLEARKMGTDVLQRFYQEVKEGKLLLSDAFPYIGEEYYLPKPMKRIEGTDRTGDSVKKKAYKKLKYIPAEMLGVYLSGKYDVLHTGSIQDLGFFSMKTVAAVRGQEETLPYRIGAYFYYPGNGVYIIVGYEGEEQRNLAEELLENLSYTGIGGKKTSGLGKFNLYPGKLAADLQRRLEGKYTQYMTLSVSLPRKEEMEKALREAEYLLGKRSGFVDSEEYAKEQMRKRDLYVIKTGACFYDRFLGDVYDVSGDGGSHPVYRYAKPMFLGVDV